MLDQLYCLAKKCCVSNREIVRIHEYLVNIRYPVTIQYPVTIRYPVISSDQYLANYYPVLSGKTVSGTSLINKQQEPLWDRLHQLLAQATVDLVGNKFINRY